MQDAGTPAMRFRVQFDRGSFQPDTEPTTGRKSQAGLGNGYPWPGYEALKGGTLRKWPEIAIFYGGQKRCTPVVNIPTMHIILEQSSGSQGRMLIIQSLWDVHRSRPILGPIFTTLNDYQGKNGHR